MIKRIITTALTLSFLLGSSQGLCDDTPTIGEIQKGEKELSYRYAKLKEINMYHAKFAFIRNNYVVSEDGLLDSVDKFHLDAQNWINTWSDIMNATSLVDDVNISDIVALGEAIKERFEQQRYELTKIDALGKRSIELSNNILKRFDKNAVPKKANFKKESHRRIISALIEKSEALKTSVETIPDNIKNRMNELYSVMEPSRKIFMERLRRALIESGRFVIGQAMQKANDVLMADEISEPKIVTMKSLYREFRILRARSLYFGANETLLTMREHAAQSHRAITNSNLPEIYTQEALDYIDKYLNRAEGEFKMLQRDGVVKCSKDVSRKLTKVFERRCNEGETGLDCSLLKTLARISPDQIGDMNEEELRNFESTWLKVGKLSTRQ